MPRPPGRSEHLGAGCHAATTEAFGTVKALPCQGAAPAFPRSGAELLTCWFIWPGPSDSPTFTQLVLAALGSL